jgi:hypothetical protein
MKITDFDSVLKNLEKHLNIAGKANKRKNKIIKILSTIDIPVYQS